MIRYNFLRVTLAVFFVLLLLCGCASNLARQDVEKAKSNTKESVESPPPVPPQLRQAPLLEIEPQKEKLFSFSAKGLALEEVLSPLCKEANLNVIWDKEVNRKNPVSVSFQDLTLPEALDDIFASTEYMYSTESPTLHIRLTDTRIFELGHVPNKITSQIQIGGNVLGSIPNAGGISGQFQITGSTDQEAVDFWKQVEEGMKSIISSDGRYFINKLAGMVTMTDRKKNLRMAENFIQKIKSSLSRQVLIEAEVVEVTLEQTQSWGIDWSAIHSFLLNHKNIQITANQTLGLPGSVVELTASRNDATLVLDLLGQYGKVNVLSKPRINVINGQTALINVGRVVNYWELTGIAGGAQIGQPIVVPTQKTVLLGLTMGVTPYISSDDCVTMQVVPIVSDANTWSEFQFEKQTLKAPNVDIREISTLVQIKNGETIIIGGLISSKLTDTEHKVPLLGDLPLLGYLFKRKEKTEQKAELVIFLTAKITTFDKKEN
jgi:MSHA type pilus biogenesis protein MshL